MGDIEQYGPTIERHSVSRCRSIPFDPQKVLHALQLHTWVWVWMWMWNVRYGEARGGMWIQGECNTPNKWMGSFEPFFSFCIIRWWQQFLFVFRDFWTFSISASHPMVFDTTIARGPLLAERLLSQPLPPIWYCIWMDIKAWNVNHFRVVSFTEQTRDT